MFLPTLPHHFRAFKRQTCVRYRAVARLSGESRFGSGSSAENLNCRNQFGKGNLITPNLHTVLVPSWNIYILYIYLITYNRRQKC